MNWNRSRAASSEEAEAGMTLSMSSINRTTAYMHHGCSQAAHSMMRNNAHAQAPR